MAEELAVQRILAVDDYPVTLRIVKKALSDAHFEVWTASSGRDALDLIKKRGLPHLAIFDLHMPGMNGFELCDAVHKFSDLPVIMLTANDNEETVIHGLDNHAEDYIVKPFSPAELVARVRRVLRRLGDFGYTLEPIIRIDDRLQIDFPNRCAFVKDEEITLTPTEAKLLYILMRNAGRTVTTKFLLDRIWPMEEAFEDRLHAHVYRLRRKIEPNAKDPTYVISQWGTGYTFPARADAAVASSAPAELAH